MIQINLKQHYKINFEKNKYALFNFMHIKNLLILSTVILFSACNDDKKVADKKATVTKTDVLACYHYIKNKDTIVLKTITVDGFITGTLEYIFFEKDKNQGTILGQMKDGVLIADYTFMSEGVQSVRQVAFKRIGNTFVEGYGDIENKNGKDYFKNIDRLKYQESKVLTGFNCEK
jgi:hypothetical protein